MNAQSGTTIDIMPINETNMTSIDLFEAGKDISNAGSLMLTVFDKSGSDLLMRK